jgi:hypothetical protein
VQSYLSALLAVEMQSVEVVLVAGQHVLAVHSASKTADLAAIHINERVSHENARSSGMQDLCVLEHALRMALSTGTATDASCEVRLGRQLMSVCRQACTT